MGNGLIFVQIAAYRDAELLPTLRDCVAQAEDASRLRFGLCWQRAEGETLEEFAEDPRMRLYVVAAERSRGACWARQQIQTLYRDEEYTLQLDSHHRFAPGWDAELVRMLEGLRERGFAKPLLTAYVPIYEPTNDPEGRHKEPLRMRFDGFTTSGPFAVMPETMDNYASMSEPEPARFFSGHFAFTLGVFCREVPYDSQFYFFGEEPSLAIRAFTHGYDLFHPHRVLVWHHYIRNAAPKHWADHRRWHFRNELSMMRFRSLIGEGLRGVHGEASALHPCGLGTVRGLREYERYTGISFELLGATPHTMKALPPPGEDSLLSQEEWYATMFLPHEVEVPLDLEELGNSLAECDFVFVGAHSKQDQELCRHDLRGEELEQAVRDGRYVLRFLAAGPPVSWTVWPYVQGDWGTKVTRRLDGEPITDGAVVSG